jgi:hypothetical protein
MVMRTCLPWTDMPKLLALLDVVHEREVGGDVVEEHARQPGRANRQQRLRALGRVHGEADLGARAGRKA